MKFMFINIKDNLLPPPQQIKKKQTNKQNTHSFVTNFHLTILIPMRKKNILDAEIN